MIASKRTKLCARDAGAPSSLRTAPAHAPDSTQRTAQGHTSGGTCAAQPNGVALSPDGRTLYVTDTAKVRRGAPHSAARTIYRYDVTRNGPGRRRQLANRRVFAMAAVGAPDGIKARSASLMPHPALPASGVLGAGASHAICHNLVYHEGWAGACWGTCVSTLAAMGAPGRITSAHHISALAHSSRRCALLLRSG